MLAARNHNRVAIALQFNRFFGVHPHGLLSACSANYSVVAGSASPCSAALTVCQAKLAHLTRAGNLHKPERSFSLPTFSSPLSPPPSPVSIQCPFSPSSCGAASAWPLRSALSIDAEALEVAHP